MKPFRSLRSFVTAVLLIAAVFLASPPRAQAQEMRTNDIAQPFALVTAGVSSNTTSWGNAGGYAAATSQKLNPGALGVTFTWSFSCATVTLAAASCVLQGSTDNATWHNVPNANGAVTIFVPASAASANNTNVVYSTNVSQAAIGNYSWWRIASITNGNAASLTSPRLTAARW